MLESVNHLLICVSESDQPWEVPLGMITPREPHFWSQGDASHVGGGTHCPGLKFWFDIAWTRPVRLGVKMKSSASGCVHINSLEFIVVILQLMEIHVGLLSLSEEAALEHFPKGSPNVPVWLGETDNSVSKSWENRATAQTSSGQGLVPVHAKLLRLANVHAKCDHLAGELNEVADDVSRDDFSLPPFLCCQKLFLKHPSLASHDCFLPSPDMPQLMSLRLCSKQMPVPCVLPKVPGWLCPPVALPLILFLCELD